MKNLLKILTMVAILAAALFFAGCKQFLEDPEEFLNYWASEVIAGDYSIDKPTQTNTDGVQCIPSTSGVRLTVKLHNPKNFTLVMPTSSADAGKVINFPGLSPQPVYSTEYTLQQAGSTLNLVYKSAFLKKHEWSSKNIGPEITFISTDGRKFSKKFSLNLKVDTPPKLSSTVTIGKTANPIDSKYYYVIILKAEDMSETTGTASELLHKDITTLAVEGGNLENISFTAGHTAFAASGRLLASGAVNSLGSGEGPGTNSSLISDPWALRYRTDTEVKTASKTYTFTLIDAKGLKSSPITVPTPVLKAEDVKLSYGSDTIPAAAAASPPSNPYTINAGLNDTEVTVTAKTATIGAKITGKVEKQDGSSWVLVNNSIDSGSQNEVDIRLPAPKPNQEVLYKISLTAGGDGFDTGTEKVFYVKVTKHTTITISSSESDAWTKLKTAVQAVTGPSKIIISGTITAPVGEETITVNRAVTIQGSNKANDKLDGGNQIRIFHIWTNGDLKLEKLTLLNGEISNISPDGGGAIYCTGGKLTTEDVIIENCNAKNGGAIYAKGVESGSGSGSGYTSPVITLNNTQIKSCAATGTGAEDGRGGAICCIKSSLKLNNTTIGGNAPTDGNTAMRGGGIYFAFEKGQLDVSAGSFISYNKATNTSGAAVGGGGVYVQSGEFVLNGTVSNNEAIYTNAWLSGGGVYVGPKATFTMKARAKISGNKAPVGAGVYISAYEGAGAGSFTMEGGEISGCHAGGPEFTNAQGGGVYIKAHGSEKGSFDMQGGTITDCTAEANTANKAAGGGVYADVETVFKMSGGAVITPSTPNTLTKSFNDVYLHDIPASGGSLHHKKAVIIVTGVLANNPVAKLTMRNDYDFPETSGYHWRNVVEGEGTYGSYPLSNADVLKFEVTPQITQPSPLTLKNWKIVKVDNAGQLQPDP